MCNRDARRRDIAKEYLAGKGIEVGALNHRLPLPACAKALNVDRHTREDLVRFFPELDQQSIAHTDLLDDAQTLNSLANASQDFVVANHILEHLEDPIGGVMTFFRVLKPGGVLYLAIPDKRFTFDCNRDTTCFNHIFEDHKHRANNHPSVHYEEWMAGSGGLSESELTLHLSEEKRQFHCEQRSIHCHVWTQAEMLELVVELKRRYALAFELELFLKNGDECILIIRKAPQSTP